MNTLEFIKHKWNQITWRFEWYELLVFALAIIVVVCMVSIVVFFIVDWTTASPVTISGVVKDKLYKGGNTQTSIGFVGGDTTQPIIMTSSSSDEYKFVLLTRDNIIEVVKVKEELFYQHDIGDFVNLNCYRGKLSKSILGRCKSSS